MRPFFSTIIPTYNRAHLLSATLDSVLAQEFDDNEIIVVDDGSTDQTEDVLENYSDCIRVFRQRQRGPGAARNLGIEQAQGRYVAFLDSDDLWFPWTLRIYERAIREYNFPSFITGAEVSFQDQSELAPIKMTEPESTLFSDYFSTSRRFMSIIPSAVAVSADAVRQVGGFTNRWVNAEDSDLWLRLGTSKGFVRISQPPLFGYRDHAVSAMADFSRTFQGIRYLTEQEKIGRYPGGAERRRERLAILSRHVRPTSLQCLEHGEAAWGWDLYKACWRWNVRLGRVRYLVGFPWLFLLARARDWRMQHAAARELARKEPVVKSRRR